MTRVCKFMGAGEDPPQILLNGYPEMIQSCSDGLGEPTFDDLIVEIEFLDD